LDSQGRYFTYLGAITPLPQDAFGDERERWLGVTVENKAHRGQCCPRCPTLCEPRMRKPWADKTAANFVRARADGRLEASAGTITTAVVRRHLRPRPTGEVHRLDDAQQLDHQ
jgi:hypothetical protein